MSLIEIENPIEQFIAFIEEREGIRVRRAAKLPYPWTQEIILQMYRFTNIHREDDKVSLHYQKTIRNRYMENPVVYPATVLYRWFNRITTCDALFNEPYLFNNRSVFEEYIYCDYALDIFLECINKLPPPHVTGSFIVTGKPGYPKSEGVLRYFHDWCNKDWSIKWLEWKAKTPTLAELFEWTQKNAGGLGSFMTAQIVADLKYLPMFLNATDWWTWASSGPGSRRGLNIVNGLPMDNPWNENNWLDALKKLNSRVTPMLEAVHIGKLHNQDLQNCLCEFSKFTKVARGTGRPRQVFRHV